MALSVARALQRNCHKPYMRVVCRTACRTSYTMPCTLARRPAAPRERFSAGAHLGHAHPPRAFCVCARRLFHAGASRSAGAVAAALRERVRGCLALATGWRCRLAAPEAANPLAVNVRRPDAQRALASDAQERFARKNEAEDLRRAFDILDTKGRVRRRALCRRAHWLIWHRAGTGASTRTRWSRSSRRSGTSASGCARAEAVRLAHVPRRA